MHNDLAEDPKSGAATDLAAMQKLSLSSLGSLAGAGLLDRNHLQMSNDRVKVAAFNSSI